ncbi:MAG TPA: hypothetical protein VNO70_22350 [Blastocatellia bacterium]|nr:hypothetical protein [Blastocatellia bacterium]
MDQQTFYIVVAVAAVVITLSFIVQAAAFVFIYMRVKQISGVASSLQAKVEPVIAKAEPVLAKVGPVIDQAKETFDRVSAETRAVAAAVSASSKEITELARRQAQQIGQTIDHTTATLNRQVTELDRLLVRTQDRIEYTTLEVQSTLLDPVREVSALLAGVKRTLEVLFNRERKQIDKAYQDEEMFI